MSRRNLRTGLKTKTAALLILALLLQNAFFAFADISGAGEASENTDTEVVLQSENTSFVSFPSRFSDQLDGGFEEMSRQTLFTPFTSFMILFEIFASKSCGM